MIKILLVVIVVSFVQFSTAAILYGLNGTSAGWQVYPNGSYHYGPTIIIEENDNSVIHMWTCSPGKGVTENVFFDTNQ